MMRAEVKPVWRTIRGERVRDLKAFVAATIAAGHRRIDIGTDSLVAGRHSHFVTVVAMLNPGKGGRAIFRREVRPRIESLRERLLREVWLSVDLGLELNALIPASIDLTIHVDANPVPIHRSSHYVQELTAMVVSQGFRVALKPAAWAATHAADHVLHALAAEIDRAVA
jgi:predicted RNase H-related nuclease YkuK (DUF458 family)